MQGSWRNGKQNGRGVCVDSSGTQRECEWQNGK